MAVPQHSESYYDFSFNQIIYDYPHPQKKSEQVCFHICLHTCSHMWRPEVNLSVLPQSRPLCFFNTVSTGNQSLLSRVDCMASKAQGTSRLGLPSTGIRRTQCPAWLLREVLAAEFSPSSLGCFKPFAGRTFSALFLQFYLRTNPDICSKPIVHFIKKVTFFINFLNCGFHPANFPCIDPGQPPYQAEFQIQINFLSHHAFLNRF